MLCNVMTLHKSGYYVPSSASNYLFTQRKNVGVFHHRCTVSYVDFLLNAVSVNCLCMHASLPYCVLKCPF